MSFSDNVKRDVIKPGSIEEASREYYHELKHGNTSGGSSTANVRTEQVLVPTSLKSTLGSPVS